MTNKISVYPSCSLLCSTFLFSESKLVLQSNVKFIDTAERSS